MVEESTPLKKILDLARAGDDTAAAEWMRTFLPGACFLIRRRLGKADVEEEARSVLEKAIVAVQADASVTAEQLPGMIRGLICQRFPAEAGSTECSDPERIQAAKKVLNKMLPVERDALRRCYVLGEAPESFLSGLRLTIDEFRAIQTRARAEFSAGESKQANVA
jgi:hypothetical protein